MGIIALLLLIAGITQKFDIPFWVIF